MGIRKAETIICSCERCGHEWSPYYNKNNPDSLITPPIICPNCKTPYWRVPRIKVKRTDVVENV